MTAGRAICPDAKPPRFQRNVVEQNDNPLGRDFEESGKLQNGTPGQIHIGLGFQKKQLHIIVAGLIIQPLKFQLIHFHTQLLGKDIQCPKTAVVTGAFIFFSGIAQPNNEPAFGTVFLKHYVSS